MDKSTNNLLANRLHELREKKGLSQAQMAEILGVGDSMYCRIEKGNRPLKSEQLEKAANILDVDIKELQTLRLADQFQNIVQQAPDDVCEGAIQILIKQNPSK